MVEALGLAPARVRVLAELDIAAVALAVAVAGKEGWVGLGFLKGLEGSSEGSRS